MAKAAQRETRCRGYAGLVESRVAGRDLRKPWRLDRTWCDRIDPDVVLSIGVRETFGQQIDGRVCGTARADGLAWADVRLGRLD